PDMSLISIVVGDPLQIEPVFTVPSKLIKDISGLSPHTSDNLFSPDSVSVQNLADAANKFGTYIQTADDNKAWIGSPLRVHRRCLDPMFSLSNTIAYSNKMIFGLNCAESPHNGLLPFGSSWIDIGGAAVSEQSVPAQCNFMIQLIHKYYKQEKELPSIYIISPFKAVKKDLTERLKEHFKPMHDSPPGLTKWASERIGTVHTFQGKEEGTVFMILGADKTREGAISWASSKPNLLNVATTRAKRHFFLIGDKSIWGGKRYFTTANQMLPTKDITDALTP
ncbi:MAG TPA: hypothetical protein DCS48_14595, partial [Desulfovibrio sp.]|nr:hypothetical protein [Desulfovibrio sp.]